MRAHLARLIREQTAAFVDHVERARDAHSGAMHQARVVSRRLREGILLAHAVTSKAHGSSLIDDIRRCSMAMGAGREMTVALREFETEAAALRWGATVTVRVGDHLVAERDRRIVAMQTKLRRI